MQNPKEAIKQIQALTYGAYQASGQVAALIGASRPENMAEALEQTAARMAQCSFAPYAKAVCRRFPLSAKSRRCPRWTLPGKWK